MSGTPLSRPETWGWLSHCRASLVLMDTLQVEQKCEGESWIEWLALCQLWATVPAHSISLLRSVVKMLCQSLREVHGCWQVVL